jgi:hypothetical protein
VSYTYPISDIWTTKDIVKARTGTYGTICVWMVIVQIWLHTWINFNIHWYLPVHLVTGWNVLYLYGFTTDYRYHSIVAYWGMEMF